MDKNEIEELIGDFLVETSEIVDSLDHDLVELEHRQNDLDLLNKIFRGAHTMKGSSSFLGFNKLTLLTHNAEEVLNKLRKGDMVVTQLVMDVLLEFVDSTKELIEEIQTGEDTVNIEATVQRLKDINLGGDTSSVSARPKETAPSDNAPAPSDNTSASSGVAAPVDAKKTAPVSNTQKQGAIPQQEQTIRVDVSRLDALLNLVGELVLSRNRLSQLSNDLDSKFENEYLIEQLLETTSQIGMNTTELQLAVMKTRMIPIGKVFSKFPRMVRDLSRDSGKDIELVITGEETELDKSVVEEIGDPLIHLIRNSCDHGCEAPEARLAKGKPEKGIVELKAYHEGNHIVIEIKDDGAGMDPEKLKSKAIEKGIMTQDEALSLTDEQAYAIIFRPGFSTTEKVTNISGRGVGMDVVRTNVEKLNGIITIKSEIDQGSTFYLKLPLTLAIIQALLVEVSEEVFAIPLASVVETVRVSIDEVHSFEGREVLKLRDRVLSLVRIDRTFGLDEVDSNEVYVVIVGLAEKQLGFIVNNLIGQEEIVIKSLGEYITGNSGIAGATITGDGRVRLIIDVAGTMELAQLMPRRSIKSKSKNKDSDKSNNDLGNGKKDNRATVLICDDSPTDRKITRKVIGSLGLFTILEVSSAKDAIATIIDSTNCCDILLTDIMMPDMDGFKLCSAIREKGIDIPIIGMSSRVEPMDRKKMVASGMNCFVQKPLNKTELLGRINELIFDKDSD